MYETSDSTKESKLSVLPSFTSKRKSLPKLPKNSFSFCTWGLCNYTKLQLSKICYWLFVIRVVAFSTAKYLEDFSCSWHFFSLFSFKPDPSFLQWEKNWITDENICCDSMATLPFSHAVQGDYCILVWMLPVFAPITRNMKCVLTKHPWFHSWRWIW